MNPKIEKLNRDIEKTETKIAELQDKLRDLKKQKTELENNELIAICHDNQVTAADLLAYFQSKKSHKTEGDNED